MSVDLISNPEFSRFKIVKVGTVAIPELTVTAGAGDWADAADSEVIAHSLGFKPLVAGFWTSESSGGGYSSILPRSTISNPSGTATASFSQIRMLVNNENLIIDRDVLAYGTSSTIVAGTVTYYLYAPTAGEL